jgi:hypothetical protein
MKNLLIALAALVAVGCSHSNNEDLNRKYKLSVTSSSGGTVTASHQLVEEGQRVTITANSDVGYKIYAWTILEGSISAADDVPYKDQYGDIIDEDDNDEFKTTYFASQGIAKFNMPGEDVLIHVDFIEGNISSIHSYKPVIINIKATINRKATNSR